MKGLLLKDYYVLTKQLTIILLVIPVMAFAGGGSLFMLTILIGASLPMTALAYDEMSKWNGLAVMMPYSRRDLIVSKYMIGYFCVLITSVLAVLGQFVFSILTSAPKMNANSMLFYISIVLIFIAMNMPIIFKFGTEKGRFFYIVAIGAVASIGTMFQVAGGDMLAKVQNMPPILLIGVAIILNIFSIMLSISIKPYKKK